MTDGEYEASKQYYLILWRRALKELLQWPDEKINEWMREQETALRKPKSLVMTETPLHYIAREIVVEFMVPRPGRPEVEHWLKRIEDEIIGGNYRLLLEASFDWNAARKRVFDLIGRASSPQ